MAAPSIKKEVKKKKELGPALFGNIKEIVKVAFKELINTKPEYVPAKKSKIVKARYSVEKIINKTKERKPSPKIWDIPEQFNYSLSSGRNNLTFTLQKRDDKYNNGLTTVGNFYLEKLKGCGGVAVLYYLSTVAGYYNRGFGTFMHDLAERIAYDLGMFLIQGTVTHHMTGEISLLNGRKGWKRVGSFKNENSGNQIYSYIKALR